MNFFIALESKECIFSVLRIQSKTFFVLLKNPKHEFFQRSQIQIKVETFSGHKNQRLDALSLRNV